MKKSFDFAITDEGDIDFRATLKMMMRQKDISIAKLARDADLNYGTVFYFLNGKKDMRSLNLCKLFNLLNKI